MAVLFRALNGTHNFAHAHDVVCTMVCTEQGRSLEGAWPITLAVAALSTGPGTCWHSGCGVVPAPPPRELCWGPPRRRPARALREQARFLKMAASKFVMDPVRPFPACPTSPLAFPESPCVPSSRQIPGSTRPSADLLSARLLTSLCPFPPRTSSMCGSRSGTSRSCSRSPTRSTP